MNAVAPARRAKTPRISGLRVARYTIRNGLDVEGPLVRAAADSDIVRFRFMGRTTFLLRSPEYVDHVLHEAVDHYHKSREYEMLRSVVGLSLFTDEGESWRRHRMMLNPVMAKRHIEGLFDLMVEPIPAFLDEIDDGSSRIEIEMAYAMTQLTLDVVGAALFGRGFGDLARKLAPTVTSGLRAAEVASRVILATNPPWWIARASGKLVHHAPFLPPPLNRLHTIMRTIDDTVWAVIHERQGDPGQADDLLGLLLTATDAGGNGLPLRRVRDEATTFMLAGHETTANAMAWMWYLLAVNPEARERMLAEVDSVLGGRRPALADLPELRWTTACFQEAMRIFPPAWVIPRECVREDVIDGHRIRKRATILIPIYTLHHDERFWPEPERFDPERFMGERAREHHRSAYLPFGGGRRICIGSSFALLEATLITAMMSQRFAFDLVPGHRVEPEATLTLRPRYGLRMIGRRRNSTPEAVAA